MCKYIGIDISKQTFDVVVLGHENTYTHFCFENNIKGFNQLLRKVSATDIFLMEASGPYYLKLAHFLFANKLSVSVVNPLVVRRFCQMRMQRTKTDKKDALMLAHYARAESPSPWKPEEQQIIKLKQINTAVEQLDKQITALKNQLEALEQMPVIEKQVRKSLKRVLEELQKQKRGLEQKLEKIVVDSFAQSYEAIKTIPGIGTKTAAMLIAISANFSKFSTYRQLLSYVGLSPRTFQSGTSVKGKGHICKMGMGSIRKLLYMCSWSAKRYNGPCKQLYDRLKAKGKAERVIKIAIANKLLRQAFAIAKSLSMFDKNYKPKFDF